MILHLYIALIYDLCLFRDYRYKETSPASQRSTATGALRCNRKLLQQWAGCPCWLIIGHAEPYQVPGQPSSYNSSSDIRLCHLYQRYRPFMFLKLFPVLPSQSTNYTTSITYIQLYQLYRIMIFGYTKSRNQLYHLYPVVPGQLATKSPPRHRSWLMGVRGGTNPLTEQYQLAFPYVCWVQGWAWTSLIQPVFAMGRIYVWNI